MAEIRPNATDTAAKTQFTRPADRPRSTDPARDGLVGLYALRILDRGIDPRALVAEHRSTRYGLGDRIPWRYAAVTDLPPITDVGRGAASLQPPATQRASTMPSEHRALATRPARARRLALPSLPGLASLVLGSPATPGRNPRRLVTAGFAVAAMLGLGVMGALALEQPAQQRYVVQPGDSLETVAATFGVSPDAILASSAVQAPPDLTPAETIIIPDPDQTPEEAAIMAAAREGSSPFVMDAYVLEPGDTLADVATWYQVPIEALAAFNGITAPELLDAGQRLLIPASESVLEPAIVPGQVLAPTSDEIAAVPVAPAAETEQLIEVAQPVDLAPEEISSWTATEVFVPGVAAYQQEYNLSPAYASGFIATSAFGAAVPETTFIASVPLSPNPHWGYRGNLNGDWGNTTDYGVYAEPLVPVLNANGFNADVFYSFGDPAPLRERLDAGRPVIAWLGFYGDTAFAVDDHGSYLLAPGMQTVVVYGYDDYGVHVSNPATGSYDYYLWDDFLAMWSILDGMGLAVSPW